MASKKTPTWTAETTPMGLVEVAALTGLKLTTVRSLRTKKALPDPDGTVSGNPIWLTATVTNWWSERQAAQAARKEAKSKAA